MHPLLYKVTLGGDIVKYLGVRHRVQVPLGLNHFTICNDIMSVWKLNSGFHSNIYNLGML